MMPVAGQDMVNVSPVFPGYPSTQNMTYPTQNYYPSPHSNFHYPTQLQGYHQSQYPPQQNFVSQPQSPSQSMYPSLSHYPTEPRQYSSQSHFQSHSHSPSSQYFNSRVQVVRSSAQWSAGLGLSSKFLPLRSKKQGDLRNSLVFLGVTPLWPVAQWVSPVPPHHTLPAFPNLNSNFFLRDFRFDK